MFEFTNIHNFHFELTNNLYYGETMPPLKPREELAESSVANQPKYESSKMRLIAMLDIGGDSGNSIAQQVGMSWQRISVIRTSPIYMKLKEQLYGQLQTEVIDKKSTAIATGDPVENAIKNKCMAAIERMDSLMENSDSDSVRLGAANSILDRGGYKSFTEKTKVTVEVTEKMASRFERVLGNESSNNARESTVRITKEMS